MSMAVIKFGYVSLVMPTEQAVKFAEMALEAEVYQTEYAKDEEGKTIKTHHIFKKEDTAVELEVISDTQYKMYKLAGKPK